MIRIDAAWLVAALLSVLTVGISKRAAIPC